MTVKETCCVKCFIQIPKQVSYLLSECGVCLVVTYVGLVEDFIGGRWIDSLVGGVFWHGNWGTIIVWDKLKKQGNFAKVTKDWWLISQLNCCSVLACLFVTSDTSVFLLVEVPLLLKSVEHKAQQWCFPFYFWKYGIWNKELTHNYDLLLSSICRWTVEMQPIAQWQSKKQPEARCNLDERQRRVCWLLKCVLSNCMCKPAVKLVYDDMMIQ